MLSLQIKSKAKPYWLDVVCQEKEIDQPANIKGVNTI